MSSFREIVDSGIQLHLLADHILAYIRSKHTATLKSLASRFKVDPTTVEAAIEEIINWGYRLKTSAKGVVSFVEAPDTLTATEIGYHLKTKSIGHQIHAYRVVKSTNDLAAQMADSGAPEGTIVTAEQQSQGRGRLGRSWYSPEGMGIYVSIVLRPKISPEQAPGLSIMTAVALAETLESYCPGEVAIKWPNDVLLSGRKVAGILTELSAERTKINYVVVGVGINVNQRGVAFPDDIRRLATSLRIATKKKTNRAELLKQFLVAFEKEYTIYQKAGLAKSRRRIKKYSSMLGHAVRLVSGAQVIQGTAVDINASGALVLDQDGRKLVVSAGEVSVLK